MNRSQSTPDSYGDGDNDENGSDDDSNNNNEIRPGEASAKSKLSGKKQEDPCIVFHESYNACHFHASKYNLQCC